MSAPYFLAIRGNFVLQGYEPDGDSVRFIADNPQHFQLLKNAYKITPSKRDGSVQLRFDGIDAPELHYGSAAQPLGGISRDTLLLRMGFSNIQYASPTSTKVVSSTPEKIPGTILSAAAEANGRPVAYVLLEKNAQGLHDGNWIHVSTTLLDKTLNVWSLTEGMAYYTVYTSAPIAHRQHLQEIAKASLLSRKGVWDLDTTAEFELVNQDSIGPGPGGQLILPKLFRRSTDYLKDVTTRGYAGNLSDWIIDISKLHSRSENDRVLINNQVEVNLSDLLDQRNKYIAFTADLLEIAFVEKL